MPTLNGFDYSFARPPVSALKAAGAIAVARYLTGDGKALTAGEAAELHAAGIGIVLNFEADPGDALLGAAKGAANGQIARAAANALGAGGLPIYYSVDRDITTAGQFDAVLAYLHAADNAAQPSRCYAEYDVVTRFGRPAWQTIAWSNEELSPLAVFYQWAINQTLDGSAVDYDEVIDAASLGAWWPPGSPYAQGANVAFDADEVTYLKAMEARILSQVNALPVPYRQHQYNLDVQTNQLVTGMHAAIANLPAGAPVDVDALARSIIAQLSSKPVA